MVWVHKAIKTLLSQFYKASHVFFSSLLSRQTREICYIRPETNQIMNSFQIQSPVHPKQNELLSQQHRFKHFSKGNFYFKRWRFQRWVETSKSNLLELISSVLKWLSQSLSRKYLIIWCPSDFKRDKISPKSLDFDV